MSFKVICVKKAKEKDGLKSILVIGDPYVVTSVKRCGCGCNADYYTLAEDRSGIEYKCDLFATCNGPSEVEIAEERIAADAAELDIEWSRLVTEYENA
jgi:hypothetical protein